MATLYSRGNDTRCVEAGLVKGEHMSVDGGFIQANADHHSRVADM